MPMVSLNSSFFDALEKALTLPEPTLDFADDLDVLMSGDATRDPKVLQLSSTLIRIEQELMGPSGVQTYELRISGSGIGPVSSLKALIKAIDQGFATGAVTDFQIRHGADVVFDISLGNGGYVFSSGNQSITIDGTLPITFTQMNEFVALFDQLDTVDSMTDTERGAFFDQLSDYGVTGLSLDDGAHQIFGFEMKSNMASISVNGLTLSAKGTFPDNFGADLAVLWDIGAQIDSTGTVDFATLDGLAVTSIKITDPAGKVLGTMLKPLNGTDVLWRVDGKFFDQVAMDMSGSNFMRGEAGAVRSVLAGLDGDDLIIAGGGNDLMFGGTGNDTMQGDAGFDRLNGGAGRDVLTGGGQADVFVFTIGGGYDRITDFQEGVDRIELRMADSLADLHFTDLGADVRIDFNTVHITVANIEVADLAVLANFVF